MSIKIDHYEFKRVEQFLGIILTEKNNIAARILPENKCYYRYTKLRNLREMSLRMKEQ